MARKNLLAGLTESKLTAVNSEGPSAIPAARSSLGFTGRGALGAVTRSIDDLAARANAAKDLETRLTAGQVIVELDPTLIDASFVTDRMSQDDAEYRTLRDSIAQSGQDSPILVRPHPNKRGRYQVAFGHRRLRAAKDLAKPVRAVVRQLSDRELILAQGQENSARANLSFIERARFAHKLEAASYDRETIMRALSVDKTTVSRLISVVSRIPAEVIDAIGPAPATGRDRWVELANHFREEKAPPSLASLLTSSAFLVEESDARFHQVWALLGSSDNESNPADVATAGDRSHARSAAEYWYHSSGALVMKVATTERVVVLSIDNRTVPGFGAYLLSEMENLVSAYLKSQVSSDEATEDSHVRGRDAHC